MKPPVHTPPSGKRPPLDLLDYAEGLRFDSDGVWRGRGTEQVSYPAVGNDECFALEDSSFWFAHRNHCIRALLKRFPTPGPFFDIGGGNGFVAAGVEATGLSVVLVEPGGFGVCHARERGIGNIVHATLNEARFRAGSLPAVGFFDVLEHIEDEQAFLREVHRCLLPGGRIYVTVPAGRWLWSDEDKRAGHFRRYTPASLQAALERAGFRTPFVSRFFSPLPLPVFVSRTLPSLFGRRRLPAQNYSSAHRSRGRMVMDLIWSWEQARLARGQGVPCGTSCLAVAELS